MKKSTKAALFSAVIFPGAGLYLLKHYVRASIFFVPALIAIIYIVNGINTVVQEVTAKASANPNALLDTSRLSNEILAGIASHMPFYHQATWLFVISWIISIVSSYFAGKRQELLDAQAPEIK